MSKGFNVSVEIPKEGIDKIIKDYKKMKRYEKSSMFAIEKLSNKDTKIDKLIDKYNTWFKMILLWATTNLTLQSGID